MDPLSMIIGLVIFAAGWVAGRIRRRQRTPRALPAPLCACAHGINYHDESGPCHATRQGNYVNQYDASGRNRGLGHDQVPCMCQRYVGPEILPSVWAQPTQLPEA